MKKVCVRSATPQRGASLVEVLVAMVILAVGLLSLVSLHGRLQVLQIEAYQRAQALVLLNDIAARIVINRNNALNYATTADTPVGVGVTCESAPDNRAEEDLADWCNALQGASERLDGGILVGAMVGGRGCVEQLAPDEYLATVAWQGLAALSPPPATVACGRTLYDNPDSAHPCQNDRCRRVVTTIVRIGNLDPA